MRQSNRNSSLSPSPSLFCVVVRFFFVARKHPRTVSWDRSVNKIKSPGNFMETFSLDCGCVPGTFTKHHRSLSFKSYRTSCRDHSFFLVGLLLSLDCGCLCVYVTSKDAYDTIRIQGGPCNCFML